MDGPLSGVKVVDFSRLLPGALAGMYLADLGADVVKVETMPHGDYVRSMSPMAEGVGLAYVALNQNKRSIQVDHRTSEGQAIIHRLAATSQVFLDVSRSGALRPYHLDPDSLMGVNPRLVHCAISAYGSTGPFSDWPAHAFNIEAFAGLLSVTEAEDGSLALPDYSGTGPVTSLMSGCQAAMAICAALCRAGATGEGSKVEISCLDVGISINPPSAIRFLNPWAVGAPDVRSGTRASPKYAAYLTLDGRPILLCAIEPKFWETFCDLADRKDLKGEHHVSDASDWGRDRPWLYDEISAIFATKTEEEWMELFAGRPLPVSPINSPEAVLKSHYFDVRGLGRTTKSSSGRARPFRTVASPILVDSKRMGSEGTWSDLGEDTDQIMSELGYDGAEVQRLVEGGVVRRSQNA